MVKYYCPKCTMEFYRKSNYERHLNKKFNCELNKCNLNDSISASNNNSKKIQKIPKTSKMFQNALKNNNVENICISDTNNTNINNNFYCDFCFKTYSTKGNLNKHLKNNCKVKIEKDNEKENIFKMLLIKDNEVKEQKKLINEQKEMINKILEQNQTLIKKIGDFNKLKNISTPIKITKNINLNNTLNNTNNIVLFNFGKEDLNIIDKQIYFDKIVKKTISGVKIPEEILKIIHFNPNYPQLSNIYMSDINREKCMIFEDNEWKLSPVDKIPEVIEKVVNYSNDIENELRTKFKNNKSVNDRLNVVNKYIKMNNNEYIEELKDDKENNKELIKRCENFQKLTYDTLKTTLYNEGKNIKKITKSN